MAAAKTDSVVATAGHVDHGKSSLINRLTGMDPDRFEEEKRRGLTIDLGYAWCTLPSGRDVGFVDVPGHEKFVHNMLAGVGPVRVVLFVVAADEGWKPQTEEHLAILDLLGVEAAVIAVTKTDLADASRIEQTKRDIEQRIAGTTLENSPMISVSSNTGEGLDDIRDALDGALSRAGEHPAETSARPRLFVDRVFSIKGAGTVVTGTLTGGSLHIGDEVELSPGRRRARVRGLQTHKRSLDEATAGSRVAVNLSGMERTQAKRGDVLGLPGEWRTTRTIEATLHPVRGLDRGITEKGAFKMYAGSAEVPAKIRLYDDGFLRLRLDAPVAAEVFDRYVLRDDGRGQTVGGGVVLDIDPPRRPGPDPVARLTRRATASRHELIDLLIEERGTVRTRDILALTGVPFDPKNSGEREWLYSEDIRLSAERAVIANLTSFHAEHPLAPGRDVAAVRNTILEVLRLGDDSLADALLQDLESTGAVRRQDSTVRLPGHETRPSGDGRFDRLVEVVGTEPPTLRELQSEGFSRDEIEAAVSAGVLVRVSPDFVMTTEFVERAQMLLESDAQEGITVSTFRERMNTSRKYAIPLLEYFDAKGVTRRVGDLRIARSAKS